MKSWLSVLSILHLITLWGSLSIAQSVEAFWDAKTDNVAVVTTKATSSNPTLSPTSSSAVNRSLAYYYDIDHFYCPSYSASNTNSATNYATTPQCYISVCGGYTVTLGSCSSDSNPGANATCSGNQALRLLDVNGNLLATSGASCGTCSHITYYANYSSTLCQTLSIWEGCFSSDSCSGQVNILLMPASVSPTLSPTLAPTTTVSRSWAIYYESNYYYCPYYAAGNTNSATTYATTSQCYISMCPGNTISLGSCSNYAHGGLDPECSGNQILRLVDSSGNEEEISTATCGTCAQLTYTAPSYSSCQTYSIWEGCYSEESCSGEVVIHLITTTGSPTLRPSPSPSISPTFTPTLNPNTKFTFTTYYSAYGGLASSTSQTESIWVQSLADVLGIPSSEVVFISISTFSSTTGGTDAARLTADNTAVNLQVNMMLSDLSLPYGATLDDALAVVNSDISWLESPSGLQSLQNTLISVANGLGDSSFSVSVTELQCSTVVISSPVDGNDDDGDGGDGGSSDAVFYVLVVVIPIVVVSVLCVLCWWLWRNYRHGSSSPSVVVVDQQQGVSSQDAAGRNNNSNNNNIDQSMTRDLESMPVAVGLELVTIQPGMEGNLPAPFEGEIPRAIFLAKGYAPFALPSAPPLP